MNTDCSIVPIPLATGGTGYVLAGPTRHLPSTHKLVRCAREIPVDKNRVAFDVSVPDFTAFDEDVILDTLPGILRAVADNERLYVGCMGGIGRTGTLLALMVAQHPAFTDAMAITYVRKFRPGSIETSEQIGLIARMAHTVHSSALLPPPVEPAGEPWVTLNPWNPMDWVRWWRG